MISERVTVESRKSNRTRASGNVPNIWGKTDKAQATKFLIDAKAQGKVIAAWVFG